MSEEQVQQEASINVDGVDTLVKDLPAELQQIVGILHRFKAKQEMAMLDKMEIDAAVAHMSNQVIENVRKHREELANPAPVADEAPAAE